MKTNRKLKSLITVALLSSLSSFIFINTATASTEDNVKGAKILAPEVSASDAKASFWDMSYLNKAFIDTRPSDRKDGITVGDLVANGGNKAMILQLAQEIADKKHGKYDSLLIARHGKLIFESYYLRGRVNQPHFQASATKAYTSLVVGRAIQLGYLTIADLDKPVLSFLKGLNPTKFVAGVEKITLHKAMTMSSGFRFTEEQLKNFRENPNKYKGLNQIQAFLELSAPITSESQSFKYQGADPTIVMQVLDAVVPGSAKDFIKNELLDKIGINTYKWRNDLDGLPLAGERSSMTSRDMINLGSLIINKGKWHGEQLISAKYLASATSGITKATENWQPDSFNYGYFWYQTDMKIKDKNYDANIAWGSGGQHIITFEELDLTIVITGHDREDTILAQVSKNILPAFVK
ncbi:serine hydrolase domain-containing protein [Pseudoalteromonas denitrificans]|uniref:CubicO group peptidase, beta-lactamase class C family n=1 Tax=Pseudoalteromonas denitrificans DSM 6059 TaxID=1123010 RepID=A0A1I1S7K0_9GAMM|nr:serine hydrolase [Pseudoalteromonas denitrificans]SFD42475.1 CubicO group peptidase, beta-lactamase class C family [Pseudoalteromonas denitrificans DSM 6059]